MKVFRSGEARRRFALVATVVLVSFVGLGLVVQAFVPSLTDETELEAFVSGFGVLAPVAFVALQALQVVVAPVPGQVTGLVSGYLFGAFWGTVYSLLGLTIGSFVAFWLSRRYGRPFVEDVVHREALDRFDSVVEEAGVASLFVLFLVPGPPDDAICFLAGLTEIDLWKLVLVAFLGRAPSYVLLNVSGAGFADQNVALAVASLLVLLLATIWVTLNRDRLLSFVGGGARR